MMQNKRSKHFEGTLAEFSPWYSSIKRSKEIREKRIQLARFRCELCKIIMSDKKKDNYYLEIHHILYRKIRDHQNIEDVVALCTTCHRKIHADPTHEWYPKYEESDINKIRTYIYSEDIYYYKSGGYNSPIIATTCAYIRCNKPIKYQDRRNPKKYCNRKCWREQRKILGKCYDCSNDVEKQGDVRCYECNKNRGICVPKINSIILKKK